MAIGATQRKAMAAGQTLTAKYKGAEHTAEVVADADGKLLYRLADGGEFKSPSAAGSHIMGGIACNGWRFWSVEGSAGGHKAKPAAATGAPTGAAKPKAATVAEAQEPASTTASTAPAPAKGRTSCAACGKHFLGAKALAHHAENAARLCKPD